MFVAMASIGNGEPPAAERPSIELRDLEIDIRKANASFKVENTDYKGRHKLTAKTLRELDRLRGEGSPTQYGTALFNALFHGELENGYRIALQEIRRGGARWRVRLNIAEEATALHCLWWESLYDPVSPPRTLGRGRDTPLSRYLGREAKDPVKAEKIKVLAVISNPSDLGSGRWEQYQKLNEKAEKRVLTSALEKLGDRVDLEFQTQPASFAEIRRRLKKDNFHVLHIVAHGAFTEGKGVLLLEKENQKARPLGHDRIGELVVDLPALQLVVLAACRSAERSGTDAFVGLAPQMIRYGVPAVVAMQDRIREETARFFTETFYRALGSPDSSGGMVDAALNWARDELYAEFEEEESWDWAIPVLFMRGDGCLFDLEAGSQSGDGDATPSGAAGEAPAATPAGAAGEAPAVAPPVPSEIPTLQESSAKADVERRPTTGLTPEERNDLYTAMAVGLGPDQYETICMILLSTSFADLEGDTEDQKLLAIVDLCVEQDRIELLRSMINTQVKLLEKRARESAALQAAQVAKIFDIEQFRATGQAS
jgi:hypothetical protein